MTGEMAQQQSRLYAALAKDLNSVPWTHTRSLTTPYNSCSRDILFWSLQALHMCSVYTRVVRMRTHTQIKNKPLKSKKQKTLQMEFHF